MDHEEETIHGGPLDGVPVDQVEALVEAFGDHTDEQTAKLRLNVAAARRAYVTLAICDVRVPEMFMESLKIVENVRANVTANGTKDSEEALFALMAELAGMMIKELAIEATDFATKELEAYRNG